MKITKHHSSYSTSFKGRYIESNSLDRLLQQLPKNIKISIV